MSADFAAAKIQWGSTPDELTLLELTKQLLEITDNSRDTELSMYLQMAGEAAEAYIDNKLALQEVTERHGMSFYPVPLRFYPFGALTAVLIDTVDVTADWEIFFDPGVPWATATRNGSKRTEYWDQLDITYTCGYDPLPAEVGYAIAASAIAYDQAAGTVTGAVRKETIVGVGSIEYVSSDDQMGAVGLLSPSVLGTLERYRRWNA